METQSTYDKGQARALPQQQPIGTHGVKYLACGGIALVIGAIGAITLCMIGFLSIIQRGVAEVREMGPWPGPEISPADLVNVDLSHLSLEAGQLQNARDEETWTDGSYVDGSMITYQTRGQNIVVIWALRYETEQAAGNEFGWVQAWASQSGNCGAYAYAYFGNSGVVHCQFDNGYDKIFWNDYWIVDIVALSGTAVAPDVLVDLVRDAIAAHWKSIAQSSD